jgi:outer membrane immunogenic protein
MKGFLLATVSMVALTSVARAADVPAKAPIYVPAPVADWTGPYLGVQGGAVRRDVLAELGLFGFELDGSKTGGTVGAVLGYNWQHDRFVYGLEGDWSWIGARTSDLTNLHQISTSFDVNWLSTIRGRAGLALDSTLFYLTGGAAFGHIKNTFAFSVTDAVAFSFTQNETKSGWTVGAGVEHMFAPNWTARAEWRYVDLGKNGVPCKPGTQSCEAPSGEFSNTLMLGLIGVNYKFGSSHAAHGSIARPHVPLSIPIWAGGYLGVQGGIAGHNAFFNDSDAFFSPNTSLYEREKTGGTVGGLLGYNWQQSGFVYGVEGDWNWIGAKTSQFLPDINGGGGDFKSSFDVSWLATLRGRAGLALDSTLFYVTGGAALGHMKNEANLIGSGLNSGFGASFEQKQTKVGWTAGVGVEHMFSPNWTARAEFRYVDLGNTNVACVSATNFNQCVAAAYRGDFSNTLKLGLVGLAYKF